MGNRSDAIRGIMDPLTPRESYQFAIKHSMGAFPDRLIPLNPATPPKSASNIRGEPEWGEYKDEITRSSGSSPSWAPRISIKSPN